MINYLQVENLTKSYGDLVLFDNISFTIGEGQRIALIGRNGSGKTTLLNILAGKDTADSGTITPRRDLRIAYLEQNPEYAADLTVLEACFRSDNPALRAIAAYEQAVADPAQDGLQEAMSRMDALAAWDYEQRAKEILSRLKINDFDKKIGQLSGGQLKRVALAAVLISEADLLILDEPTNHLDTDMTEWLEEYLTRNKAALLMVTHDRYFLDRVCSDILEVDQRSISLYKGNYAYYVEKKQERAEAAEARRESDLNLYRRELEWMRRQPQARATKARARIDSFHELETRLRSTRTQASLKLDVQATRIGTKIFEAKELCKRFGDLVILDRFNYNFARYDKLGIVGDNGCGKSTFLKLLTGIIQPDSGTIEVGESVRFGYYSQQGLDFDEGKRVIDIVTDIAHEIHLGDGRRMSASQFLQYFLFPPEVQYSYVARLSGGERKRLYLCTILMQSPNFLILDEPTNDLDIVTLGVLEEYLQAFKGRRGDPRIRRHLLRLHRLETRLRSGETGCRRPGKSQEHGIRKQGRGDPEVRDGPGKNRSGTQAHLPGKTGDGASRSRNTGIRTGESRDRRETLVRRPAVRRAYGAFGADHGTHGPDRHQKHAMAGIERDRRLIPSLHTL